MVFFGVLMPMGIAGTDVYIRLDVVDEVVPLLISKDVMKQMGTIMNMETDEVVFGKLGGGPVQLIETSTGHQRFSIVDSSMNHIHISRLSAKELEEG